MNGSKCKVCESKMELSRYTRGEPELVAEGDPQARRPELVYECINEECSNTIILNKHIKK